MSLHLIESRKISTKASRKRGGTLTSVVVHCGLVLGVFTAASARTVTEKPIVETPIYIAPVTPPKQPVLKPLEPSSQASNQTNSVIDITPINIPQMPIEIPDGIPDINPNSVVVDFSHRAAPSHGGGSGDSTTAGGNFGSGNAILNDLQVDRQVAVLSGYRTPRYPEALRAAGVEQTLMAQFVVDTLGRIESGSLDVAAGGHAAFAMAVREALANARFRPAEVAGKKVRQRVQQAFVFSLGK